MADDEAKLDLRELLKPFTQRQLQRAEHTENTQLNFTGAVRQLRVIRRIAQALSNEYEDEIPAQRAQEVRRSLTELGEAVDAMIAFDLQSGEASRLHQQLENTVRQSYSTWIETYRHLVRGSVQLGPTKSKLENMVAETSAALTQLREQQSRHEVLISRAESLSADLAAGELATYYSNQAVGHREAAKRYLGAVAGLSVALVIVGWALFHSIDDHTADEWPSLVRDLSVRVFVVGIGVFSINFCVRSYRANEHLRVANEHKSNALKTFRLFQESLQDDQAARAVVTAELVKAVFAPEQTGFLDNPGETTVLDSQSTLLSLMAAQKPAS